MKKKIILIILAIILILGGFLAYYFLSREPAPDNEQVKTMEVVKDQTFLITLMGNQDSGYEWNANYNSNDLAFVDREYAQIDKEMMNGAGLDKFRFTALKEGQTEIEFVFEKTGDKSQSLEKIYYEITVKPNI